MLVYAVLSLRECLSLRYCYCCVQALCALILECPFSLRFWRGRIEVRSPPSPPRGAVRTSGILWLNLQRIVIVGAMVTIVKAIGSWSARLSCRCDGRSSHAQPRALEAPARGRSPDQGAHEARPVPPLDS